MSVRGEFDKAASAHRRAVELLHQAQTLLRKESKVSVSSGQRQMITQLAQAATVITPGWLGQALSRAFDDAPLGDAAADTALSVRIAECAPVLDARFPVVVNMLGTGHLVSMIDADDPRSRSILQTVPLRLLAARPSDSLSLSFIDSTVDKNTFAPFAPLFSAELAPPIATEPRSVDEALTQAESHLTLANRRGGSTADLPERLLVIAGLPSNPDFSHRLMALAEAGPTARLHIVMAGWKGSVIKHATYVAADGDNASIAGVPFPAIIDAQPAAEVVTKVCQRIVESGQWFLDEDLT